ncbi:MAG: integrase arm-type DNA-binding domain-containing protein [Pseudomonadota bacterium]
MKTKGKHQTNVLTAQAIKRLTGPKRYADGGGLYLVVDKTGNKRWILRIQFNSKRRDIGLGGWPLVSLAMARTEATKLKLQVRGGIDPIETRRRARRSVPSFESAARSVHESYCPTWKNPKHAAQWISTLEHYAFPVCGDVSVSDVDTSHVMRVLSPIWLIKAETARRVRQRMSAVMDWAKAKGYRDGENPVAGVTRALPKQRRKPSHHKAVGYQELPKVFQDIRQSGSTSTVKLALEFLILTATRTSEVLHAKWTEIDWENKSWTIPSERMKAGRAHTIPLSPAAIRLLDKARSDEPDDGLIFQGKRVNQPLSKDALRMVLRRMNRTETPHGFRATFRNWSAEKTNVPREVCEAALAHANPNKTEAAYLRTTVFDKRRRLMEDWARFAESHRADVVRLTASN